jgi:hypothetical protein
MWIFLSDAMLSIVEHRDDAAVLMVRARVKGDIQRVFPKAEVLTTPAADYRFRANVPREEVAAAMTAAVEAINYDNFKNTVSDQARHDAYLDVWSATMGLQRAAKNS